METYTSQRFTNRIIYCSKIGFPTKNIIGIKKNKTNVFMKNTKKCTIGTEGYIKLNHN